MISPTCPLLPEDAIGTIFSYLDTKTLPFVGTVCTLWQKVFTNPHFLFILFTKKFGPNSFAQLQSFSHQEKMAWIKGAFSFRRVIQFLNQFYCTDRLNKIRLDIGPDDPRKKLRGPADCCNGWQGFFIENGQVSCIDLADSTLTTIDCFKPRNGKSVQKILCENDFLFGLYSKGEVLHWDLHYQKEVQILQFDSLRDIENLENCSFTVLNNRLVVHLVKNDCFYVEGVAYDGAAASFSFAVERKPGQKIEKVVAIDGHHVYLSMKSKGLSEIVVFDLQENRYIRTNISIRANDRHLTMTNSDIQIHEKNFYIYQDFKILIYEKESWNLITTIKLVKDRRFLVGQDFLIYFDEKLHFTVWGFKSNQVIYSSLDQKKLTPDLLSALSSEQLLSGLSSEQKAPPAPISNINDRLRPTPPPTPPKARKYFRWFR